MKKFRFSVQLNIFYTTLFLVIFVYQELCIIKILNMFSKEDGKKFVIALAAVMVGLAVHQKFVAPMLVVKS